MSDEMARLERAGFAGFRELAQKSHLSKYEKIGFPDSYRDRYEPLIFADILSKLTHLKSREGLTVLDIGPGCTDLPNMMIDLCQQQGHTLLLVDSHEMLALLPDASYIVKFAGRFPDECATFIADHMGGIDVILTYSVLHYVYRDSNVFDFLDQALGLLAARGQMLVGDIPNVSRRKRFFSSTTGVRFHQSFTQTDTLPDVKFNNLEFDQIDDAVILSIVSRARLAGFDSYILPQSDELPMANRREDVLFVRLRRHCVAEATDCR